MSIAVVTHLNFRGEARTALEFYQTVFGGELTIVSYGDLGSSQEPTEAKQVMWGQVAAENGFKIMAFDILSSRLPFERGQNSFYVSARFSSDEEAQQCWQKTQYGGERSPALGTCSLGTDFVRHVGRSVRNRVGSGCRTLPLARLRLWGAGANQHPPISSPASSRKNGCRKLNAPTYIYKHLSFQNHVFLWQLEPTASDNWGVDYVSLLLRPSCYT